MINMNNILSMVAERCAHNDFIKIPDPLGFSREYIIWFGLQIHCIGTDLWQVRAFNLEGAGVFAL